MPPACNVVFPEECASVGYNRRMMLETTRLQLQTFSSLLNNQGGGVSDELLKNYYFAPALDETKFKTLSSSIDVTRNEKGKVVGLTAPGSATEVINALHYEHEKYTGIIPRIEQISDTAFYAAAQRQISATAGSSEPAQDNTTVIPDSPVDIYAQRAATFNLLRYRYAGRSAGVSARFMPRLVAGFPALVVNRPKEVDTDAPIHFLGLISSLSHTVGQSGGTTNFQLSYARQHNIAEDEDSFLSGLKGLQYTQNAITQLFYGTSSEGAKYLDNVNRQLRAIYKKLIDQEYPHDEAVAVYQLACSGDIEGAKKLAEQVGATLTCFDKGPDGKPVDGVAGVWFGEESPSTIAALAALVATNPSVGLSAFELVGATSATPSYSTELLALFDADQTVTDVPKVLSLSITEKGESVSFEQAITPPWFSASYGNTKISSDIYEPALGCASLGTKVGDSSSAQAASEKMVEKYSASPEVKAVQGDPKFVYDYTHRDIPSLSDVLAFHANAFDPAKDGSSVPLYGLDPIAGGVVEKSATVLKNGFKDTPLDLTGAGYLDPRQERQKRVSFYLNQLNSRSAFRG
jgi:hypothetical protein